MISYDKLSQDVKVKIINKRKKEKRVKILKKKVKYLVVTIFLSPV
jgi:hypothetical protein